MMEYANCTHNQILQASFRLLVLGHDVMALVLGLQSVDEGNLIGLGVTDQIIFVGDTPNHI